MREPLRRAVFLDRDGVLNRAIVRNGTPHPPATLAELEMVPDASRALEDLKAAGFLLIGVTNQPDVARGTQSRAVVESINAALLASLPLQEILVCYHDDGDGCDGTRLTCHQASSLATDGKMWRPAVEPAARPFF
jgi:D-glycero-D-manno-heptose 1,7-bisphosphate phosphatase